MRRLEDELGDIESVPVDPKEIRQWDREYAFLKLATDLMREAAQYTCVLACAFVGERDYWTRNEAILGGHLVRLFKHRIPDISSPDLADRLGDCIYDFSRGTVPTQRPGVHNAGNIQ